MTKKTQTNFSESSDVYYTMYESMDYKRGCQVLASEPLKNWEAGDFRRLQSSISYAQQNNNKLKVEYYLPKENQWKIGRFKTHVQDNGNAAYCYQSMMREVRGALAADYYHDVDIANCHPSILLQMCHAEGIDCDSLEDYCNNRQEFLNIIMETADVTKDMAKTLILRLMYNGSLIKWCKENGLDPKSIDKRIKNFASELKTIQEAVLELDEHEGVHQYYEKFPSQKGNTDGAKFALLMQTYERRCIEAILSAMEPDKKDGYEAHAIIHDGLHVTKLYPDQETIPDSYLRKWEAAIKDKLGFDLTLTVKPFTVEPLYVNDTHLQDLQGNGEYDASWMSNINMYDFTKSQWEAIACAVRKQNIYIVRQADGDLQMMNKARLQEQYFDLMCTEMVDDKPKTVPFINKWLRDPKKCRYESYELLPPPLSCPDNTFNAWRGYEHERIHPSAPINKESDGVKTLLNHIYVLLKEDESCYKYMLAWIAQMIQQPGKKPEVAIVLYSACEGTGKDTLVTILRKLVGDEYYYHTTDPANSLYGRFTKPRLGKLLIDISEASTRDGYVFKEAIKEIITSTVFDCEEKGVSRYLARCFARLIFTTNNSDCLAISESDRRFVAYDVSTAKVGDTEYFDKVYEALDNKHTMRELYQYFKEYDITGVNLRKDRPNTFLYDNLQSSNIEPIKRWLAHYVTNTEWAMLREVNPEGQNPMSVVSMTKSEAFRLYKEWLANNGFDFKINSTKFGGLFAKYYDADSEERIPGFRLKTTNGARRVEIQLPECISHVEKWL